MLPRRRSTPSIRRRVPPASTRPAEAERGDPRPGGPVGGNEQRRAAVDRLTQDAPVDRERADGVAVDGEEAAVHPGDRRAPACHRAGPLEARHPLVRQDPRKPPVKRLAIDGQDVHAPGAALADDRRPADPGRDGRALAPLVERARAERQIGGLRGARHAGRPEGRAGCRHGGARPAGWQTGPGCGSASRAAGSSPGCGFHRGRLPVRRTGSCPWTFP